MAQSGSFTRFAKWTSHASGRPATFVIAVGLIVVWACTGPVFHFSDTWQLVINTGTTVVTFLMVFLIQNTQNRDATAMQIKLDELIRAVKGAHNAVVSLEDAEEDELLKAKARYDELAEKARRRAEAGGEDTGSPELEEKVDAAQDTAEAAADAAGQADETAQEAKGVAHAAHGAAHAARGTAHEAKGEAEAAKDRAASAEERANQAAEAARQAKEAARKGR